MAHKCTNCFRQMDDAGKYCSMRCRREGHQRRRRMILIPVLSLLALSVVIHFTSGQELRPEPNHPVKLDEIKGRMHDDACPICAGLGKLDCRICIKGRLFYLGTSVACRHCQACGWVECSTCKGTGKLDKVFMAKALREGA